MTSKSNDYTPLRPHSHTPFNLESWVINAGAKLRISEGKAKLISAFPRESNFGEVKVATKKGEMSKEIIKKATFSINMLFILNFYL